MNILDLLHKNQNFLPISIAIWIGSALIFSWLFSSWDDSGVAGVLVSFCLMLVVTYFHLNKKK